MSFLRLWASTTTAGSIIVELEATGKIVPRFSPDSKQIFVQLSALLFVTICPIIAKHLSDLQEIPLQELPSWMHSCCAFSIVVSNVEPAKWEKLLCPNLCQVQLERFFVGSVVGIGPRTRLEQNDRCTKLAGFSEVSSRRFVFALRRPNGVKVGSVSWRPSCDQESHPKHMQVQSSKAMFMTTRSFTACERLHVVSHNPRCLPLVISKNNKYS